MNLPRVFFIVSLSALAPASALANWPARPGTNQLIASGLYSPADVALCSDGEGGAIIIWVELIGTRLLAQRVDRSGKLLWESGGVEISSGPEAIAGPRIIEDGGGGAIAAWFVQRSYLPATVRVQRINRDGLRLWSSNGIDIPGSTGLDHSQRLAPDGSHGAIVTWTGDSPSRTLRAQRIDASGTLRWGTEPIAVASSSFGQFFPAIVPDGQGGAVIAWQQGGIGNADVAAQRLDRDGNVLWGEAGTLLCGAAQHQTNVAIGPDAAGGFVAAWQDGRGRVHAQRVDGSGATLWAENGVPVATLDGTVTTILPDGAGGVYLAWAMTISAPFLESYVQRLASDGRALWSEAGVAISPGPFSSISFQAVLDGSGGLIVPWSEARDVWAQRFDANGASLWQPEGVVIATSPAEESPPRAISDGGGGAILVWTEVRGQTPIREYDVYAQHVNRHGKPGPSRPPEPATSSEQIGTTSRLALESPWPSPTGGSATIRFNLPQASQVTLAVHDVSGHRVRLLQDGLMTAGSHAVTFDGRNSRGARLPSGIYLVTLHDGRQRARTRMVLL